MSRALLKQSLAIVEESLSTKRKPEEKDNSKTRKNIKRRQQPINLPKKKPAIKITLDDIYKENESRQKLVEKNLEKLLKLSKSSSKIRNPKNIVERARTGRYIIEKEEKVEQESMFTEDDFAAFEKELAKTIASS